MNRSPAPALSGSRIDGARITESGFSLTTEVNYPEIPVSSRGVNLGGDLLIKLEHLPLVRLLTRLIMTNH